MFYDPQTTIHGSAMTIFVNCSLFRNDKDGKVRFFGEIFLLADISTDVILGIPFLTSSNADVRFSERQLFWRAYTEAEALLTTRRVEIIDRKEFAAAALNKDAYAFVMHVTFFVSPNNHHKIQLASLIKMRLLLLSHQNTPRLQTSFPLNPPRSCQNTRVSATMP